MKKSSSLLLIILFVGFPLIGGEAIDKELMTEMDDWFPYASYEKKAPVKQTNASEPIIDEKPMNCCLPVQQETIKEIEPIKEQSTIRALASNGWVQGGVGIVVIAGVVGWKFCNRKQS